MALTLTVEIPESVILGAVLDALAERLSSAFVRSAPAIRSRVGRVASAAIVDSPEFHSVVSGQLRGELGIVAAEPVLLTVCRNIAGGVLVTPLGARRSGSRVEGGMRIELLKGDYSEVLGAGGSFRSEGGFDIDWLEWLTLEGDRVLVGDHHFVAGAAIGSRTGLGLMVPTGTWRVPPQFSGTAADNFITRAIIGAVPVIERIVSEELSRSL